MPANQRTIPTVLAELSQLRRHAHDAPPHHGGGRDVLEQRLRALEAELAHLRAADRHAAGRATGQHGTGDATTTPPATPGDGSDHGPPEPD